MGLLPENEVKAKHAELCKQLNLEENVVDASWDKFQKIQKNYTLEGDVMQWLGFAIFEVCHSVETQTVDQSIIKWNCVRFTSLLRHSNLSFAQFFLQINKWIEMSRLGEDFQKKVKHLKNTFSVAFNTFLEYQQKFNQIFVTPDPQELDQRKQHRNRKQKPASTCSSAKIFEFTWNLFNTIKMEEPNYSGDLTQSFHILYSCLDLTFKNALMADRRDILRSDFAGLPAGWASASFNLPMEPPCIIKNLCKCEASLTDALHTKAYKFREHMTHLFDTEMLQGETDTFLGLLNSNAFDSNLKSIARTYELQLSTKCCFDERIFISEYRRQLLEQQVQAAPADCPIPESPRVTMAGLQTPLTGRQFVDPKEHHRDADIDSELLHSKSWLQALLADSPAAPSERLSALFESCTSNPMELIEATVDNVGGVFKDAYVHPKLPSEVVSERLDMSVKLFYKLIDGILQHEKSLRQDISSIVTKEAFYKLTLGCALEIVTFVYDGQLKLDREFPWMLDALEIKHYDFVKVIEPIVRNKGLLSRQMIKHLSRVEETILESLAWCTGSVLWETIEQAGGDVPKFCETTAARADPSTPRPRPSKVPSATDAFQSPVNRRLFQSRSVLQGSATHIMYMDPASGQNRLIPIVDATSEPEPEAEPVVPKRTGSLPIFFRKFYHLASERLDHLCSSLDKSDLMPKIWTIFEESITQHIHLMKDRHLDQLLMCAVYVIARVCNDSLKFTDVMRCYRQQPQATSDIYRNVLLVHKRRQIGEMEVVETEKESRGDLIQFYNRTYMIEMKATAMNFGQKGDRERDRSGSFLLSPLPAGRRYSTASKVHVVGNVFVKPFESPAATAAAAADKTHNYYFNRSPSKELLNINRAINVIPGKRLLNEDGDLVDGGGILHQAKRNASYRKVQTLMEERKSQNLVQ